MLADYVKFQITNSNLISKKHQRQYIKKIQRGMKINMNIKKIEFDWDNAIKIISHCKKIGF